VKDEALDKAKPVELAGFRLPVSVADIERQCERLALPVEVPSAPDPIIDTALVGGRFVFIRRFQRTCWSPWKIRDRRTGRLHRLVNPRWVFVLKYVLWLDSSPSLEARDTPDRPIRMGDQVVLTWEDGEEVGGEVVRVGNVTYRLKLDSGSTVSAPKQGVRHR
jgi:hypothetical protein